jgi:hypothetical protein
MTIGYDFWKCPECGANAQGPSASNVRCLNGHIYPATAEWDQNWPVEMVTRDPAPDASRPMVPTGTTRNFNIFRK